MLADAAHVLVQVAGGPAMTLSEVEILMQELGRHINDHTQILFGTSVDGRMGNRLSVTLISSLATEEEVAPPPAPPARASKPEPLPEPKDEPVAPPAPPIWEQQEEPVAAVADEEPVFADELIQVEEPAPEIAPEPAVYLPEEPVMEEATGPASRDSSQKEARSLQGTATSRGEKAARETGSAAIRAGHARPF